MALSGKAKCKKYPKAVWNSMTRDQQMQARKLQEQQGIKPPTQQTSADARISALEAQLGITSQPKQRDVKKKKEGLPKKISGEKQGKSCGDLPGIGCKE